MSSTDTLPNSEGKHIPTVTFKQRNGEQWQEITTDQLFKDKSVIVFALPGAFTPTCSSTHLPRYNELVPCFKKEGIDDVICLSVNDPFVMQSWAGDQNTKNITFVPDGNGEFSAGMNMLVDKSDLGFGKRSWRYSMLVKDGVIEKMFIEPNKPGDPFEVSDADTMLNYLNPKAEKPMSVSLFTKPGCPHCARAKKALTEHGYSYEEISVGGHGLTFSTLKAVTGKGTVPQVFVNGEHIGTADETEEWLKKKHG